MGRTNPTYRDWLRRTEEECQPFRRALRQQYQADFDRLFEHADQYADAAGYVNRTDPTFSLLLSMLLAQQREIRELRERYDDRPQKLRGQSEGPTTESTVHSSDGI